MSEDEITKEKIFSACQDRFLKEGFASISVDEIATDLGISKKTFYKHFSSKEDVVKQIIERVRGVIRGNIERILLSDKSSVEKLSEFIAMLGTTTAVLTPTFGRDIQKRIPQLWTTMREFRQQKISEVFTQLLNQGVSEGSIRPDMNSRVFLLCVLGTIDAIMQPHILAHESFSVSDAIQEILNTFFRGGLTDLGRKQFEQLHIVQQQNH